MQPLHPKYYQLNPLAEKNDWVLLSEEIQELLTKKIVHKLIF